MQINNIKYTYHTTLDEKQILKSYTVNGGEDWASLVNFVDEILQNAFEEGYNLGQSLKEGNKEILQNAFEEGYKLGQSLKEGNKK